MVNNASIHKLKHRCSTELSQGSELTHGNTWKYDKVCEEYKGVVKLMKIKQLINCAGLGKERLQDHCNLFCILPQVCWNQQSLDCSLHFCFALCSTAHLPGKITLGSAAVLQLHWDCSKKLLGSVVPQSSSD